MSINTGFHEIGQHCNCYNEVRDIKEERDYWKTVSTQKYRKLALELLEMLTIESNHTHSPFESCKTDELINRANKELS